MLEDVPVVGPVVNGTQKLLGKAAGMDWEAIAILALVAAAIYLVYKAGA